ncbi:MAG: ABC transporter permease [Acetobacterales bacterium]
MALPTMTRVSPADPGDIPGGADPLGVESPGQPTSGQLFVRRVVGHGSFVFAATIIVGIILMALLAPWLAPHDPYNQDLGNRLVYPIWTENGTWLHPLGTDALGRDYLSRVIYGSQISLIIGFTAMTISGLIGTTMGVLAGYFGGRVDMVVTFLLTTRLTLPVVMVALALVVVVGGSLYTVILVLGFLLWDRFTVVMRSTTQQVRSLDYVAAAEAIGCSTRRIILSEIMPNVLGNLLVIATFEVAHSILLEAALSFLGVGVQPPTPSWGLMVAEGRDYMLFEPYLIMIPGFCIFTLVLAINMLGDGARDILAPENRS